jgi:hypothetical protein
VLVTPDTDNADHWQTLHLTIHASDELEIARLWSSDLDHEMTHMTRKCNEKAQEGRVSMATLNVYVMDL